MPARTISLKQAKENKLFYVVVTAVIYRENDKRCLILKRDPREKVHPGRYAVPGGKLEWKDLDIKHPTRINGDVLDYEQALEQLLKREIKEEAGIEVYPELKYIDNVAFIRPDEIPVILMKFAMKYKSGKIILEKGSFTDFAWVNAEEVKNFACVDGIPQEVAKTIQLFRE